MRLIDRDDFNALDPSGLARDVTMRADGTQDPGPYLWCVNDQGAWVGRLIEDRAPGYSHFHTGQIHVDTVTRDRRWKQAVALWLDGETIDAITLVRRYKGITGRLKKAGRTKWVRWDEVCHWKDTSDLLWDGLAVHRVIERRENNGMREVRIK